MSTGGIFTLITNDGKQDRMLMATELLEKRLRAIREQRAGLPDPNPTLVDIEKTHLLFMNAHFKPFAAIGYEYNRVQPTSGAATFGGRVQYNIPQFGDFFSDMGLHVQVNAVTAVGAGTGAAAPTVRYCDYPGERLLSRVQMEVNGNPLDEYFSEMYNAYRQFTVQPNKLTSWKRCMGQEVEQTAFLGQTAGSSVRTSVQVCSGHQTPKAAQSTLEMFIPLMFWFNKDARLAIPSVSIPQGQRYINIQMAEVNQMIVALNNGLPALSAANGGLTADASYVTPTIARADLYINNIFVNPDVHDIFIARIGFSLIRVHRRHTAALNVSENSIQLNQLKWPIESLFVGFRPTENVNSTQAGSSALKVMQDWHKFSQVVESSVAVAGSTAARRAALVSALSAAVSADATAAALTATGANPLAGSTVGDVESLVQFISANAFLTNGGAYVAAPLGVTTGSANLPGFIIRTNAVANAPLTLADLTTVQATSVVGVTTTLDAQIDAYLAATGVAATSTATLREQKPLVSTLKISAHGIPIYNDLPAQFFNAYTPFVYGSDSINSPTDPGAYFIPFCLYPGSYQPSGHINVSRAREFYLDYKTVNRVTVGNGASTEIGTAYPVELQVIASCINFLLISDGSAVLRYST